MTTPPKTLTASQAADRAGVTRQAIGQAIRRGTLKATKATPENNSPYIVTEKDFNEWNKNRPAPKSKAVN